MRGCHTVADGRKGNDVRVTSHKCHSASSDGRAGGATSGSDKAPRLCVVGRPAMLTAENSFQARCDAGPFRTVVGLVTVDWPKKG
jgi:hypothetical protein